MSSRINNKKTKQKKKDYARNPVSIREFKKYMRTSQYRVEIDRLKKCLQIMSGCGSMFAEIKEKIDKDIKEYNQFMLASALGELRQDSF
jgi:hypothetical protein